MITHIVSDMGGVLVDIEWTQRVSKLLDRDVPIEELHRLWVTAKSTVEFETGRIDFDQFAATFIKEFSLDMPVATFQHEFLEIVRGPSPNCEKVLGHLKNQNFHLSLLSNTSTAHYGKLRQENNFFDYFDEIFLSYELGVMKPDAATFEHILSVLDTPAETVAFFDDGNRNVEAACRSGIQGYRVDSPDEIMKIANAFRA
jgi:putative hydrolase of the HAD superfamily